MKKRMFFGFLAAILLVAVLAPAAGALETNIASGTCGEGIEWSLDGYTLTISGSGEMEDGSPWAEHKDHIEHVVLTGGVTKIGKEAFDGYDRIESVEFGDALVEIGERAFQGCEKLNYIHLPSTFRFFGKESFLDCYNLRSVYCDGGMPRFNPNCLLTGNYVAVFYRTNHAWPADSVQVLVSNYGGRLGVMMGNFEDSSLAGDQEEETEQAQEETQETAEETTESTTQPQTQPTEETVAQTIPETTVPPETQSVVTETTQSTTAPETEPATTALAETVMATEEPTWEAETVSPVQEAAEQVEGNSWIGMLLIAGVLTFLIAGALIFRSASHKGGRYRE